MAGFLSQFFPPYWSLHYFQALLTPLRETLQMAAGGIFFALIFGLVTGIWAGSGLPGGRAVYRLLSALRAIPDLTLAILCVVVVGIGAAAGMFALAIFYTAAIGKIFADLFLTADPQPVHALRSTGANRLQVALFGLLPLRLKDVVSYGFYEFESAIRASVIVGAVGGGGIGTELVGTLNAFDYRKTTTLLILLILVIAVVDRAAVFFKRHPGTLWLLFPAAGAAFFSNLPEAFNFSHALRTFSKMFPPELPPEAWRLLPKLLWETAEIAIGGTALAALAALPLGLAAARNFSPAWLSFPVRRFLEALRAIPELVWGLVLVSTIGIGPKAGVLALAFHAAGALGRLYAESFENIVQEPIFSLQSSGAPPLSIALFGIVPLAAAPLKVHTQFRLEWNIRAATVVGVIGAGGIGQALYNAQQLFFYRQMVAYILITAILIGVVPSYGRDRGSPNTPTFS